LQGFLKVISLHTLSADDADPAEQRDDVAADFKNNFYKNLLFETFSTNLLLKKSS